MTSSSLAAALRVGCGALLAFAMCRCGLSAEGQGALVGSEDGASPGSSGGVYGGSSSGAASSSGAGSSSGGGDDAGNAGPGDDAAAEETGPAPKDSGVADARKADAAAKDAGAGPYCTKLDACCPVLASLGTSASSVQSCYSAATGGVESTCLTVLGAVESIGLCL